MSQSSSLEQFFLDGELGIENVSAILVSGHNIALNFKHTSEKQKFS